MITIQIHGKTYTVAKEKMGVYHRLQQFIKAGYLEEVKENKENPITGVFNNYDELKEHLDSMKDTSILEKLREEIVRREKEHRDCEEVLSEFGLGAWQAECELLAFLTSLETNGK